MLYDLASPVEPRMERSHTGAAFSSCSAAIMKSDAPSSQTSKSKSRFSRIGGFGKSKSKNEGNEHDAGALDDTHTGGENHIASNDFLRVVRVMMFLGPRRGKSTSVGDGRGGPGDGPRWIPRSELDVSGHSFRRGIKANLERAKAGKNLGHTGDTEAAKRHLDKLRSPPRRIDHQHRDAYHDCSSLQTAADHQDKLWDTDYKTSSGYASPPSFCYDSSSSTSTHPASSPSGSPQPSEQHQAAEARRALPPRARPPSRMGNWSDVSGDDDGIGDHIPCPSSRATMRNGGRKLWRNDLVGNDGEYAIRECPVEGEYIVEKIVPST